MCRELTKMHEEVLRGPLPELAARVSENPPRGEIAVVIGGLTRARRGGAARSGEPGEP
jgi:16S rRNA (cytidine1402-2'-O)-methyltransferase